MANGSMDSGKRVVLRPNFVKDSKVNIKITETSTQELSDNDTLQICFLLDNVDIGNIHTDYIYQKGTKSEENSDNENVANVQPGVQSGKISEDGLPF